MSAKITYYRQCHLVRKTATGEVHQVSWIPEQFAEVGKVLKLQQDAEWVDGWIVSRVGDARIGSRVAVDNPNVMDAVGTARDNGAVVLTIANHLPWNEAHEHLVVLQAKLNRYLEFIEGGQLAQEYPNARSGVPV